MKELCNLLMDSVVVTSYYPSSPHQIAPPLLSDMGENENTLVEPSHPPNITPSDFREDLAVSPIPRHMYFVPQPPSSYCDHPSNDTVLCSSFLDSALVLNKDRSIDRVGVAQPTCTSIHEEHDRELEHPPAAGDHPCISIPPPFFPDILVDPSIPNFSCAFPSTDAPIVDHFQDTPDIILPSNNGEDQSFIENPLDISSSFSKNTEGEHPFLSYTPLFDSSNHEDSDQNPEFSDLVFRDLFTSSSVHDVDSLIIWLSH